MVSKKQILIVDDHPLFREGLKAIIGRSALFEVLGEAGTCRETLRLASGLRPDLVLIDISLPDQSGVQLTAEIRRLLPNTKVIIVSVHSGINYIAEAFQAGAVGYVVKESVPEALLQALEIVSAGGFFLEGALSEEMVQQIKLLAAKNSHTAQSRYDSLTNRQKEVMQLLAQGLPSKAIADKLCISLRTVEHHRAHIMDRLAVKSVAKLSLMALRLGLIEFGPHGYDVAADTCLTDSESLLNVRSGEWRRYLQK